ncbi:hypothetical protein ACVWXM_009573 [Bradyrhizobium sp. GM7.3]
MSGSTSIGATALSKRRPRRTRQCRRAYFSRGGWHPSCRSANWNNPTSLSPRASPIPERSSRDGKRIAPALRMISASAMARKFIRKSVSLGANGAAAFEEGTCRIYSGAPAGRTDARGRRTSLIYCKVVATNPSCDSSLKSLHCTKPASTPARTRNKIGSTKRLRARAVDHCDCEAAPFWIRAPPLSGNTSRRLRSSSQDFPDLANGHNLNGGPSDRSCR